MEVLVEHDVPATMRDGTTLMANVYRPAEGDPHPVLLTRTPYGKDAGFDATYLDPVRAARDGYVVVVQDVRGRYASEGRFVPFFNEYEDGYDTVEWAAGLPGSNGRVGMFGESYFGKTQWQAAAMAPPSLSSMVPGITWGNHLNGAQMRGGAQELGTILYWARAAISQNALLRKHRDDPETLRERLPEIVGLIDDVLSGEGYDVFPLSRLPDPEDVVPFVRGGFARGVEDLMAALGPEGQREMEHIRERLATAEGEERSAASRELSTVLISAYFADRTLGRELARSLFIDNLEVNYEVNAALGEDAYRLLEGGELRERLPALRIPTLVLHGEADPLPARPARELAALLPNAELAILPGTGHLPWLERLDAFRDAIWRFLTGLR